MSGKPALSAELCAAAAHAAGNAEEGVFHSIFGPGGPAPAREASYQVTIQLGYLMSELNAYYDAFAYTPASGSPGKEPPDHVSVEAGFMGFLRLKQAFALAAGSEAESEIAREAADRFLQEHLSNLAEPLSHALDHSGQRYLELAGKALVRRTGPARKQVFDLLDQDAEKAEGCSFECGEA
ncbi:MAG: molecular chaperone TorD family protein [Acidobacteria bacterium]|nr:molecular chaperone TorD family protein [Acidobacteriota bacterium]